MTTCRMDSLWCPVLYTHTVHYLPMASVWYKNVMFSELDIFVPVNIVQSPYWQAKQNKNVLASKYIYCRYILIKINFHYTSLAGIPKREFNFIIFLSINITEIYGYQQINALLWNRNLWKGL